MSGTEFRLATTLVWGGPGTKPDQVIFSNEKWPTFEAAFAEANEGYAETFMDCCVIDVKQADLRGYIMDDTEVWDMAELLKAFPEHKHRWVQVQIKEDVA